MDSPTGPGTNFPASESLTAASARKSRNSGWRSNCARMVSDPKRYESAIKLRRDISKPNCSALVDATSHGRNGKLSKQRTSIKEPSMRRQSAPESTHNLLLSLEQFLRVNNGSVSGRPPKRARPRAMPLDFVLNPEG